MAYTPGFDYDIFISFSHRDNALRPDQGRESEGWVEGFARYLEYWLDKRRGLQGLKIWIDKGRLTGATEFDERIKNDLSRTALFLALHSWNYRDSDYCQQELDWFVEAAKSQPAGLTVGGQRRLFNVTINRIPYQEWTETDHWTAAFAGTPGFAFHDAEDDEAFGYPIEPSDQSRYDRSMEPIVAAVHELLKGFPRATHPPEPPGQRPRVFVAHVASGLAKLRKRLVAEIAEQAAVADSIPPPDGAGHDAAVTDALRQADISIHLLNRQPGKQMHLPGHYVPRQQAQLARDVRNRALFWLPDDLAVGDVQDPTQRAWLSDLVDGVHTVRSHQLLRSSNVRLINDVKELLGELAADSNPANGRSIVIDHHPLDQWFGFRLASELTRRAPTLSLAITRDSKEPAERWTDFESLVRQAQDLIVIFGRVGPQWVGNRVQHAIKTAVQQIDQGPTLQNIWVVLLRNCPGGDAMPPLPGIFSVRLLDNRRSNQIEDDVVDEVLNAGRVSP